jgi:hypothetical protein
METDIKFMGTVIFIVEILQLMGLTLMGILIGLSLAGAHIHISIT